MPNPLIEAFATKDHWLSAYTKLDANVESALEEIIRGMSHPHPRVRRFCTALMDHHADSRCREALLCALEDPDANVRRLAVHAIGCQRCKREPLEIDAVALLITRLREDCSVRVRQVAAHMLGNQARSAIDPDPRALAALRATLATETNAKLRSNATWALGELERTTSVLAKRIG